MEKGGSKERITNGWLGARIKRNKRLSTYSYSLSPSIFIPNINFLKARFTKGFRKGEGTKASRKIKRRKILKTVLKMTLYVR